MGIRDSFRVPIFFAENTDERLAEFGVHNTMHLKTDQEKVAHLLRRFGLGASSAEIEFYGNGGLSAAIDRLLNYESVEDTFKLTPGDISPAGAIKLQSVKIWWMLRLCVTRRPLEEKMTLFWHDHFATSAMKVDVPGLMWEQNDILRRNATGSFRTMLAEVSKDPAMLFWLDNQDNVKGKPNENFAREVMELFTLGIGHYSEQDIQEAARAFTGWTYQTGRQKAKTQGPRGAKFTFRQDQHDTGLKTFLGKTGNFDGDDILAVLCTTPQMSRYITKKMWEWFAYRDPDDGLVDRLAADFRKSSLNIKTLVRKIVESPEFYSEQAYRRTYKGPVDFCVSTYRQLGIGQGVVSRLQADLKDENEATKKTALRALGPIIQLDRTSKAMGMELLFPPDVAGWDGGPAWISSATIVERIKWADVLFGRDGKANLGQTAALVQIIGGDEPDAAVKRLLEVLDAELPPAKVSQLIEAARGASGDAISARNAGKVADTVCRLLFGSPEFQFC